MTFQARYRMKFWSAFYYSADCSSKDRSDELGDLKRRAIKDVLCV